MKKFVLTLLISSFFGLGMYTSQAQTAGTMTYNVTPVSKSGSYTLRHFVACWVETSAGTFVKTRTRLGSSGNSNSHLIQWKAKSASSVVDAVTGSTLTTYVALSYTWGGNDLTGATPYNLLPDGTYKVFCEYAWDDSTVLGTGRDTVSATFIKGPTAFTSSPANVTDFTGMTVTWTPAAQNTITTTALASNTYCAGATVSVAFTKTGTTTVYNNNSWTAQLSDASGSFATPVTIGTLAGSTVAAISATIPAGTTPGTGYRIRVVGTQPATAAASAIDNGTNISISAPPTAPVVGTITQPSCATTTGSVVLNGLPAGSWTLNPGNISGSTISYTVSGLAPGTYNYTVTSGCVSPASSNIVITAATVPTVPTVGTIVQPTCATATGSVTLSGLPATGNWTINPGAVSGSGTSKTITGLSSGTYNFTVTDAGNCTSVATANVVIATQPSAPSAPTVGTLTQPSCTVATGSVNLTGLPASGTWTLNPGAISGSGSSYTVSGLVQGTYNYTVTDASSCVSAASANVVVNAPPPGPTAPTLGTITQPTCAVATGSVVLTGLPASGSWTINPGNITNTGTTYTLTGLAAGTYNYTVTTSCASLPSANVVIDLQPTTPTAPTAGTITQPTCAVATGSVVLNGLPAGNWTINPGAIGGSGTSYTFTNLIAGPYTFTVTNASNCTSPASSVITISTQPTTPTAPTVGTITQTTCTSATGSVNLTGLPSGNWTINPGNVTGSGTTYTLSGIAVGTHTYTVTNASSCTSPASANVVINTQPSVPTTPTVGTITQTTCTVGTGSVILNGLPNGNWTLNPGNITGSGTTTTINSLAPGTYNYTVTNNGSGCTSTASANIVINTQPLPPATPVATANGLVLSSNAATGNQWYNLATGAIGGATGQNYTVTANGTYFVITSNGSCLSDSSNFIAITNVGLNEVNGNTLRIYPNPVADELQVELSNNTVNLRFEILSMSGQLIYQGYITDKVSINTTTWVPAVYMIRFQNGTTMEFKKIIKK